MSPTTPPNPVLRVLDKSSIAQPRWSSRVVADILRTVSALVSPNGGRTQDLFSDGSQEPYSPRKVDAVSLDIETCVATNFKTVVNAVLMDPEMLGRTMDSISVFLYFYS